MCQMRRTRTAIDPVEQTSPGPRSGTTPGFSIEGVSNAGRIYPSDVNAAVGDIQVVEWVNVSYAVYNKTTRILRFELPTRPPPPAHHLSFGYHLYQSATCFTDSQT